MLPDTRRSFRARCVACLAAVLLAAAPLAAQIPVAPDRPTDGTEGVGPFDRLVLRGGTLIDGTGAPPIGPVDIVVEGGWIREIKVVGYPKVPINGDIRPRAGDYELDVSGMYILPGFVDLHAHIGGLAQGTPAEYVFKLWMGHGITTIRDPGSFNGMMWMREARARSAAGAITAPRILAYATFGSGTHDFDLHTPAGVRAWVEWVAEEEEADGIKFFGLDPVLFEAALDEAQKHGLGTAGHHAQLYVSRANVLHSARWGLGTMEHWYGLPEALFTDRTVQHYRLDYNYQDEQHRFGEAGRLWAQAAEPGSARWNAVIDTLVAHDLTIVPTMTVYEASRDLMRAMRAEWHDAYTLPSLWRWYAPSRKAHGAYWFDWTTEDEVAWRHNFARWMTFLDDFKNRGGRVGVGSDAGYIYKLYGFAYIRELELLREAGFHPLEVLWSATLKGAEALGMEREIGSVQVGKRADFVVVAENPLANLKVLYGTGAIRLDDETGEVERVGGVRYTIKDGIIYDAPGLLEDVRAIVERARAAEAAAAQGAPGKTPATTDGSNP